MNNEYLIYLPLVSSIFFVFCGVIVYYVHRYGGIPDNSFYNRYKPTKNSILIRLKLFKYNNNFNYFLLIPYLFAWNVFFVVLILYIIYWCGITELSKIFINKWFNGLLIGLAFLYMVYGTFIDITK